MVVGLEKGRLNMGAFRDNVYVEHPEEAHLDLRPVDPPRETPALDSFLSAARAKAAGQRYQSALDRDGSPATLDAREILDGRIAGLLLDLAQAHKLAVRLGDPRARRIGDSLAAMPGSGE